MYCNPPPQILWGCNPLTSGSYAHGAHSAQRLRAHAEFSFSNVLISSDLVILFRLPTVISWPQSENIRSTYVGLGSWSSHQVFTMQDPTAYCGGETCQLKILNMFLTDVGEVVILLREDGIMVTS
jgi:hypothetical protein